MLKTILVILAAIASCQALVIGGPKMPVATVRPRQFINMQEAPPPPPGSRLGATVDQDGKSNVWAVEPSMKVENEDKGLKAFAPVAGIAALCVLAVPLLPLLFGANPDQV